VAQCVTLNSDGTLTPTGQAVSECTGYVMVSGSEYGVYQALQTALAMPSADEASTFFIGTLGLVMFFFLVSRQVGAVAGFFSR